MFDTFSKHSHSWDLGNILKKWLFNNKYKENIQLQANGKQYIKELMFCINIYSSQYDSRLSHN